MYLSSHECFRELPHLLSSITPLLIHFSLRGLEKALPGGVGRYCSPTIPRAGAIKDPKMQSAFLHLIILFSAGETFLKTSEWIGFERPEGFNMKHVPPTRLYAGNVFLDSRSDRLHTVVWMSDPGESGKQSAHSEQARKGTLLAGLVQCSVECEVV